MLELVLDSEGEVKYIKKSENIRLSEDRCVITRGTRKRDYKSLTQQLNLT